MRECERVVVILTTARRSSRARRSAFIKLEEEEEEVVVEVLGVKGFFARRRWSKREQREGWTRDALPPRKKKTKIKEKKRFNDEE